MGTRFAASEESLWNGAMKDRLIAASGDELSRPGYSILCAALPGRDNIPVAPLKTSSWTNGINGKWSSAWRGPRKKRSM